VACLNGIPVLGSKRGGLPETLDKARLLLPIPERCKPDASIVQQRQRPTLKLIVARGRHPQHASRTKEPAVPAAFMLLPQLQGVRGQFRVRLIGP